MFSAIFEPFLRESPVSVMYRMTLERVLAPARLDALFDAAAVRQHPGELLFSTCVETLAAVVAGTRKSVHAVYRRRPEDFAVGIRALYDKLAGVETQVSERLVAATADELAALVERFGPERETLLAGYEVRLLDGNHLAGTQHRLKPLHGTGAAALPGQALVVLDPQRKLLRRIYACEDAHANERTLLPRVLADVVPGQCWVADRNFATYDFLAGIIARGATFVIRQHGRIQGEPVGRFSRYEKTDSGRVREQGLRITTTTGEFTLRRITVELSEPTRDDERELHLLTNLPAEVSAVDVARLYRERWSIETAFMHLATVLRSEIETLAYPPAALFGFALGVVLYDVLRTLEAGLRAAHPEPTRGKRLSLYHLGEEIAGVYRGLLIAIPPEHWRPLAELPAEAWIERLLAVARRVPVTSYFTHPRSNKPPPKPKTKPQKSSHNATYRLLNTQIS